MHGWLGGLLVLKGVQVLAWLMDARSMAGEGVVWCELSGTLASRWLSRECIGGQ